jgi:hypothetical protein
LTTRNDKQKNDIKNVSEYMKTWMKTTQTQSSKT